MSESSASSALLASRRQILLGAGAATGTLLIGNPDALAKDKKIDRSEAERYRLRTPSSSIMTGGALIAVNGSMEEVLSVVQRYPHYKSILPRLEQSRIVAKSRGLTDVYLRAPIMRGVAHIWGVARFGLPKSWGNKGRRLTGRLVKGNLKAFHGAWKMHPCGPTRTVLRLELFIDLKLPVPGSLITPELEWASDKGVTAVRDMVECGASGNKHA